jgi:NlpC/P60 family
MNPWAHRRVQSGTRIRSFVSRIRRVPSSLERLDSSLRELQLFSSGLTPRVSKLHIAALSMCFAAASFWIALLAKGQTSHTRALAQQATPAQSQQSASASEGSTRQDTQTSQSAPNQSSLYKPVSRYRMLTQKEERSIVKAAWAHDPHETDVHDCSHTVHQIYTAAGYDYPYASSFDLYRGAASFVRVTHPQPGDLIAWPGHVGIVLSAKKHSFYSLVSTGLQAQNYRGAYWRGRGHPHFYRYILERPAPSQRPDETPAPTQAQRR